MEEPQSLVLQYDQAMTRGVIQVRKLTLEEQKHYDELGYVVISDIFTAEELGEMNEELDQYEGPVQTTGEHEGFTYQLAMLTDKTKQFAHDERVLSLIEDIVKPGISIFSSKLLTKLPHSPSVCHWHQDDAYYTEVVNSDTRMSIWVPLQDTDERNGCLWIVPGSHKQGLQPYQAKQDGTCRNVHAVIALLFLKPYHYGFFVLLGTSCRVWLQAEKKRKKETRIFFIKTGSL